MIQIKIPVQNLPNNPDGKHLVRFRVVSVDENRTSHWVYKEVDWEYMLALARVAQVEMGGEDIP